MIYGKIENMGCSGWNCRRIIKVADRIKDRYCSMTCYNDYEERIFEKNWDISMCVCGCHIEDDICSECGTVFPHPLQHYCLDGECADHIAHNEIPDHCHNEDGDCEIHKDCKTQCNPRNS